MYELRNWFVEGEVVFRDAAEAIQSHAGEIAPGNEALIAANAVCAHSAYFSSRLGENLSAYIGLISNSASLHASTIQFAEMCALWYLGLVCCVLGKYEEANRSLQASLEKAGAHGERWYETMIGEQIGIVLHDQGEYEMAYHYLAEAVTSAHEIGDPMVIAPTLIFLGKTIHALGETSEAKKCLRESLNIAQEIGYRHGISRALDGLGQLAQVNNPNEAHILFTASCDVHREPGYLRTLSMDFNCQEYNSLTLGDIIGAHNSFITVIHHAHESSYMPTMLDVLVGLEMITAKDGDDEHALKLVVNVLQHQVAAHDTLNRAERLQAELQIRLTKQQLKALQPRVKARTFDAIMDEVLNQVDR